MSRADLSAVPAFFSISILTLAVPLNLASLGLLCAHGRRRRSPTALFMINLATSDLLFLLSLAFLVPYYLSGHTWCLGRVMCHVVTTALFTTTYTSTLLLTAIAADRYVAIVHPFQAKAWRREGYAGLACAAIWVATSSHLGVLNVVDFLDVGGGGRNDTNGTAGATCYESFSDRDLRFVSSYRLYVAIVFFFLPLLVTAFCYASVIRSLSKQAAERRGSAQRSRSVRLVAATMAVFLLCFAPFNVSHVIGFARTENIWWRHVSLILNSLNCCLDPLIYYFGASRGSGSSGGGTRKGANKGVNGPPRIREESQSAV
ncbi:free fatty acid receptor 3-like [Lethenteron reissneri]|uniref:free fatty acid receptor 3-like n=1 Tax=Lethenteron reissneri TaxID=7753 RepID=UPI002AB6A19B|nr:free fatty acid receptor 3-like [Lethenteron reissneri]